MTVIERVSALKDLMAQRGLDAYLIPTADFHESEYVGAYFKARAFMSGFTGSAGTLVVHSGGAALWTDGRYFIAAAQQLEGTGIELMRSGEEGVPSLEDYLFEIIDEGGALGFDGRVVNARMGDALKAKLAAKAVRLATGEDLVGELWTGRPALSAQPAYLLEERYAGESRASKLARLRTRMEQLGATAHVITTLDDIAWLMNIRGDDVAYNPVVLSYALVTLTGAELFVNPQCLSCEVREALEVDQITLRPYDALYGALEALDPQARVLMDRGKVNFAILEELLRAGVQLVDAPNPTQLMKAVKNPVEIENLRACHLKDGVAFTHFMRYVKTRVGREPLSEISVSDHLEALRAQQPGFIELSFETIAGYGPHAAMMHYTATPESDSSLAPEGMLLVDSGAQFFEGTTDITRTLVLGPLSQQQRLHFTTVLRSMLNLQSAQFLKGCTGLNLDILARGPIWALGLDYKCGTGHGVGFLLNVHEGPNSFRWKKLPGRDEGCTFEEGMVTTDEPGIYLEDQYGVRLENELVCHAGEKNEYGQFMYFEPITYAPLDLDGVDPELLSRQEREALNQYHAMVYEKLSPYFEEGEERDWLRRYTRAI